MKRITSAALDKLEQRAEALCAQVGAFDLDAWKEHHSAHPGRAYSTSELERDNPGWLEVRQGRLSKIAALDDGGVL